jgi:hypothetical protein
MMRGYGALSSCRRLVYSAYLQQRLGQSDDFNRIFQKAEKAVSGSYREDVVRNWLEEVRGRLGPGTK